MEDKVNVTDTGVRDDHLTSNTKRLETLSVQLERDTEDLETFGATSGIKAYGFVKPRVRWTQRVFKLV